MNSDVFDVVVVGAGAAGLTAAIGLAKAGFSVAVVEAAAFPGAENWSGCVYFCENLAHPDIHGAEGVEQLAWERRLVERGFFATDGHGLLGMTYRDKNAFRHCYTVLRPIYDYHLAQVALRHGIVLFNSTTAETLIRDGRRVIGVCTNRGALYGRLVFLAEGDASHLVTHEGYERLGGQKQNPQFLQGIKQVLEFPPQTLEKRFGLGGEEGAAYEMLLRNGTLRGRRVHLNMGGFLYTNKQSLSVGLVLPADHLHEHFGGDPNLLMEWFLNLPSLSHWFKDAKPGIFGAKIIRGGGAREIPTLIDDGLAIGGAASGIGIDFPYPNFTGPATAMGLLIAQAAQRIRDEGGDFTHEQLRRHYLEPLQRTHYWEDVEYLRRWPAYVHKTRTFFGRNIDLALQSTYLWTRSQQSFTKRWVKWIRLVLQTATSSDLPDLREDSRQLTHALRLNSIFPKPGFWQLLLDGSLNSVRDIFGKPRPLPERGDLRFHYLIAGGSEPAGLPPVFFRKWFGRFAPVLSAAARLVYTNNDTPLAQKLPHVGELLVRQVNLLDLIGAAVLAGTTTAWSLLWYGWRRRKETQQPSTAAVPVPPSEEVTTYESIVARASDLTPYLAGATQQWEARLARLGYHTVSPSHIHILWPRSLPDKDDVVRSGLWHVCPAHVYEARVNATGQVQLVVNFENCIKCETCWRVSDLVDWGRDGAHQFIYSVRSHANRKLLDEMDRAAGVVPRLPQANGTGNGLLQAALDSRQSSADNPLTPQESDELQRLCIKLASKLQEFEDALAEEPRIVDYSRTEYLQMLARYAQQLVERIHDIFEMAHDRQPSSALAKTCARLLEIGSGATIRAEERIKHVWNQRFSWAAADGRQLRYHHLANIKHCLQQLRQESGHPHTQDHTNRWLQAEHGHEEYQETLYRWQKQLNAVFPSNIWRSLEQQVPLTEEQDQTLRKLVAEIPAISVEDQNRHSPLRKMLLAELGRRDPSLAFRVASHLWARDMTCLHSSTSAALHDAAERWTKGEEWACFAHSVGTQTSEVSQTSEVCPASAFYVPAGFAQRLLFCREDQMLIVSLTDQQEGLTIEPLPTLGLRGAGISRIAMTESLQAQASLSVDGTHVRQIWNILSAADLVSIAYGMTDLLCRRTIEHAATRVQFPGLFHDEEARDAIGKFGTIKKMVAEMAACRYLMETLDWNLSPTVFDAATERRSGLVKALVADMLGTAPGSVTYNAGQVFGGTGYSEDDVLSKYYRDGAAWRFLYPNNVEVFADRGTELLTEWNETAMFHSLEDEMELCAEVEHRKALQAEYDEIRLHAEHVEKRARDWYSLYASSRDVVRGEFVEALGQQEAYLLAGKAMLMRTHCRLEQGLGSEREIALLRVWLDLAATALARFDNAVERHLQLPAAREDRPVVDPAAGPPVTNYKEMVEHDRAYNSGDFLVQPTDPTEPRYVVEMIATDPELARRNEEIRAALREHFGATRNGMVYERYIEKQHRPDETDLNFLRRQGFFRMPIPKDLGGEGSSKAEYYLLTTNAHRLSDVAVSLTIQVNSSLGTTPVLLARFNDLPKAQKDMADFRGDAGLQAEISDTLKKMLSLFQEGDAKKIEKEFIALNQTLQGKILKRPAVRILGHRFGTAWQDAGKAGKEYQLAAMQESLAQAERLWQEVCSGAADYADELKRRVEASDLFLRWVASGHISAFALTEPSAGSDTARVATRAKLKSVPVEVEEDGALRFTPATGNKPRYLLDARRLEFRDETVDGHTIPRACYRWSEQEEPAPIHFDEYDYETDDPDSRLYYQHGNRRIYFSDVAQLRERDGKLWYDYWELTGAKMWITNGRMCGIMALYAKTEEGITGFMVDRHAEGLIVGKDEEKMGQNGSPTNELSLQAVRVPRENVIGLEGRGQVNALETLNVGRAGLAMSAMTQMEPIIGYCREFAAGQSRPWIAWRLEEMEEVRFISESVAFDVIGRFEHKKTKSVRLESAIAKMLVSELLHHLIETAEEIHGLAGQTQLHLIEKRKRDARVLNIYEGTNEIQRFFILRDLVGDVARRWGKTEIATTSSYVGRETLELENLKTMLHRSANEALDFFGQQLWQNPNLQANCFLLAEAVAWLAAADSTLARLAWLSRRDVSEENGTPSPLVELGRRAFHRCAIEVRSRLKRFGNELVHLHRGLYAPEVRAASLLFQHLKEVEQPRWPTSRITKMFSILVVLEPPMPGVPDPVVVDGQLQEPYRVFRAEELAALEMALRLKDAAAAACHVDIIAAGPTGTIHQLRQLAALSVDRIQLLVTPTDQFIAPDRLAAALANSVKGGRYDLIVGGSGSQDSEEGLLAPLLAEAVEVPFLGDTAYLAVRTDDKLGIALLVSDQGQRSRSLPASVTFGDSLSLRKFTIDGYLDGLGREIEQIHWPGDIALPRMILTQQQVVPADLSREKPAATSLLPLQASHLVLETVGLEGSKPAGDSQKIERSKSRSEKDDDAYERNEFLVENVTNPFFAKEKAALPYVLAVVGSDAHGTLSEAARVTLQAARFVAQFFKAPAGVLLLAPEDSSIQQQAVKVVSEQGFSDVVVLPVDVEHSAEIKCRLLENAWLTIRPRVRAVVGESWTEPALLALSAPCLASERLMTRVVDLDRQRTQLAVNTTRLNDRFRCEQLIASETELLWLCLREDATIGAMPEPTIGAEPRIECWRLPVDRFYGRQDIQRLLAEVKEQAGVLSLSDAEFIIDVGFGVGNRDGYEEVILPLEKALRDLEVHDLMIGGSRKVTEELHLLPADRQIGQSGVSVNPKILLAIGISGAPQHLNYIGTKATIISFNRDAEAPIMTLNQRQPQPRVFPVIGDLFETVPAFIAGLKEQIPPFVGASSRDVTHPQ